MNVVLTRKRAGDRRSFKKKCGGGGGGGSFVSVRMTPMSIDTVSATVCASDADYAGGAEQKFHFRSWWHEYSDKTRALRWAVTGAPAFNWSDRQMDQICPSAGGAHFRGLNALREFHEDPEDQFNLTKPFRLAAAGLHASLTARFARTVLAALRHNVWRRRLSARIRARIALRSIGGGCSPHCESDVVKLVVAWL